MNNGQVQPRSLTLHGWAEVANLATGKVGAQMSALGFVLVITGAALFLMRRHRIVTAVTTIAVAALFLHGLVLLVPLVLVLAAVVLVAVDLARVGRRHPLLVLTAGLYHARHREPDRARQRPVADRQHGRDARSNPTAAAEPSLWDPTGEVETSSPRPHRIVEPVSYNEADVHNLDEWPPR